MSDLDRPDLASRYAGPGRFQRAVALVIVAALVLSGVGFLGWSVIFHSNPEVQSRLTAFHIDNDHQASVAFTVVRKASDIAATCALQAIAEDHTIVGAATIVVASGPPEQSLTAQIRTEREATAVDLIGCTAPGQARAR